MLLAHKALPLLLLPLGGSIVLMTVAVLRRSKVLATLTIALLYIASTPLVANWSLNSREREYPAIPIGSCPPADAIVVLSGTLEQNPAAPDGYVWTAADRLDYGVQLYKAGSAPWLVFTGGRVPWLRQRQSEGEVLRTIACRRGVPASAIAVTEPIENTAGGAFAMGKLARERGLSRIILITTAWHMPRAMMLFRRTDLRITPFPVGQLTNPAAPVTILAFLPQGSALARTETALRELLGAGYYAVRGPN
jgi:uncharacterized SAM-binding protein YcdF (DUF218 family)